jgi:hypothetical protein
MALTLSKSNIVNGNTIQAADVSQSIDAFTGTIAYDITLSGSLQLTGSVKSRNGYTGSLQGTASIATSASYALTATTATTATSASNITTAVTSSGTNYLVFVSEAGTKAPKIASLLEYNVATNSLIVTASYATTASYALNGGGGGAAYPTSAYIDNATYGSVGTAYPINASSAGMLYIDTRNNSREVYFAFSAGATNQIVTFTTYYDQTVSTMDPNFIYCTTAGVIYGLKQNEINNTTGKLADLVTSAGPAFTVFNTFQFQYTTVNSRTGWFLINISVQ